MFSGAYALICGTLIENMKIYKTSDGIKYGIITITITPKPTYTKKKTKHHNTYHLPVYIWNRKLLSYKSAHLKAGQHVWVIGELEPQRTQVQKNIQRPKTYHKKAISINIYQPTGLTLLSKIPEHSVS